MSESLERLTFLDPLLDGVVGVSADQVIRYCNEAASQIIGVSARRLIGKKSLAEVLPGDREDFWKEAFLEDRLSMTQEVGFQTGDGREVFLQYSIVRFPYEGVGVDFVAYLRDVSLERTLHEKYKRELQQKEDVIIDLRAARERLEVYNTQLESLVAQRTKEISGLNQLLKTILDNLGQGILVFDSTGKCLPVYSRAAEELLDANPEGRQIETVLQTPEKERKAFVDWREMLFQQLMPFEDLAELQKGRVVDARGRTVEREFRPLIDQHSLTGVVTLLTDRTKQVEAEARAAAERSLTQKILQALRFRKSFIHFVRTTEERLKDLPSRAEPLFDLHTIKGTARSFGWDRFASEVHHLEEVTSGSRSLSMELLTKAEQAFYKEREELRELLGPRLVPLTEDEVDAEIPASTLMRWADHLSKAIDPYARRVGENMRVQLRSQSLNEALLVLQPIAERTAEMLHKNIQFQIECDSVLIDRESFGALIEALGHAIRNAVDHGIESESLRKEIGKSPQGKITLRLHVTEGAWTGTIEDDGGGVHFEKLRERLSTENPAAASWTDDQIAARLLEGRLSSRDEVTEISGRGVGVGALTEVVRAHSGIIELHSKRGHGTSIIFKIPATGGLTAHH